MAYILRDGTNNIILDASGSSSIFFKTNNTNRLRITDASSIFLNSLDLSGNNIVNINNLKFVGTQLRLGIQAGFLNQDINTIAIGNQAGYDSQQIYSISIGTQAGYLQQANYSIAVGQEAGNQYQGVNNVAIGYQSGRGTVTLGQYDYCVSIGYQTNYTMSLLGGGASVAIGYQAGYSGQLSYAVGIGHQSGYNNQGNSAVAIGRDAGRNSQRDYAIAVGALAGETNQHSNSIVINASGSTVNSVLASSLHISPIRNVISPNFLYYNSSTKELTSSSVSIGGGYNGYYQGTWATSAPPNSTSGVAFSVPIAGNYIITANASGYTTGTNVITILVYINGAYTGYFIRCFTNEVFSHKTAIPVAFKYSLNAGTNYIFYTQTEGTSNGDDYGSFSWEYAQF